MKFSAALVACLAGFAAATGTFHERRLANAGNMTAFNVKFAQGTVDYNGVFRESVHGTPDELAQFSSGLTMTQLKQILGNSWGHPFYITYLDSTSGQQIGYLSGYFTTDGGVTIDRNSQIPDNGNIPNIQRQPSIAPPVTTVTAPPPKSASIIKAGKLTSQDLHDLLGGDFGKPFRIILTDPNGSQIGFLSGSFTVNGVKFDPSSKIPSSDSASGSGSGSTGSGNGAGSTGTGSGSTGSGSTGTGSTGSTGSGSTGTGSTGSTGTGSTGSSSSGSSSSSGTQKPNSDGTYGDPNNPNKGTLSIGTGDKTATQNKLNNLSYQDILTSVGGKYGPFYTTFQNADGSLKGYIKGYIDPKSYSYEWSYTYTS